MKKLGKILLMLMILSTFAVACNKKSGETTGPEDTKTEQAETGENKETQTPEQTQAENNGEPAENVYIIEAIDPESGETVGKEILEKDKNLVVIWQPSCPPCKSELLALEQIYKDLDIKVIGLCFAENVEAVKTTVADWGLTFENYLITEDFLEKNDGRITSTPTSLYLDKEGKEFKPMDTGTQIDPDNAGQVEELKTKLQNL